MGIRDPLKPQPSGAALLKTYRELQVAERVALQAVRDAEWEARELIRSRAAQEQGGGLEAPYYDITRIQVGAVWEKHQTQQQEPPDTIQNNSQTPDTTARATRHQIHRMLQHKTCHTKQDNCCLDAQQPMLNDGNCCAEPLDARNLRSGFRVGV